MSWRNTQSVFGTGLIFALALGGAILPANAQDRTMVPVTIDGEQVKLAVITYKPAGNGPLWLALGLLGLVQALPVLFWPSPGGKSPIG